MSANLSINNGKAEMMYTGERPWHNLGTELENPATSADAIVAAGMDWNVEKKELQTINGKLKVPNNQAIIRVDKNIILGVVGNRYNPIQNIESFDFFDSVVGGKKAIYHTAGVLDGGRRIWILAKLPENLVIAGKDEIEKFVLLTVAHDGTGSLQMMNTPVRVVCQNTLNVALGSAKSKFSVRHTKNFKLKVDQAAKVLGVAIQNYKKFEEISGFLVSVQVNGQLFTTFLDKLFPIKKKDSDVTKKHMNEIRTSVTDLYENGKGNNEPGTKRTMWTAFNAVAEYGDHFKPIKRTSPDKKLNSVWFGGSAFLKDQAWNTALELTK